MGITACNNNNTGDDAVKKTLSDTANYTSVEWVDTLKNFGTIVYGEKADIQFRCKNAGNKPLILASVTPGCGCTLADYTKEPIAPGKEGFVNASFDSKKAHSADVRKLIYVRCNDKTNTDRVLIFEGKVTGLNEQDNDKVVLPDPKKAKNY